MATVGDGVSSSVRMNIAPSPPTKRNVRIITRYWSPMTLWSVVIRKYLLESSILAVHVGVVLLGRALCAEEAADRIVEEAHARKETDDAEGIAEEDSWIGTEGVVLTKRIRDSVRADCEADDESDHGADDSQW